MFIPWLLIRMGRGEDIYLQNNNVKSSKIIAANKFAAKKCAWILKAMVFEYLEGNFLVPHIILAWETLVIMKIFYLEGGCLMILHVLGCEESKSQKKKKKWQYKKVSHECT